MGHRRLCLISAVVLVLAICVAGCGKKDQANNTSGDESPAPAAAAAPQTARDPANPLIGTWTAKDHGGMITLSDLEYTPTEQIKDGVHTPVQYAINGNAITVTSGNDPPLTYTILDNNTVRVMTALGMGGDMVRYTPLHWPDSNPTDTILTAVHAGDINTLNSYMRSSDAGNDAASAMAIQQTKALLELRESYPLLSHDCSWKVISTDKPQIDRMSGRENETVQVTYNSPTDAPLAEGGLLKQTVFNFTLIYNRSDSNSDKGRFSFALGNRERDQDAYWDLVPLQCLGVRVNAAVTNSARNIGSLRIEGLGGKGPLKATVVVNGEVKGTGSSEGVASSQSGSSGNNAINKLQWHLPVTFAVPMPAGKKPDVLQLLIQDADNKQLAYAVNLTDAQAYLAPILLKNGAYKTSPASASLNLGDRTPDVEVAALQSASPDDILSIVDKAEKDLDDQRNGIVASGGNGTILYQFLAYPKFYSAPVVAPTDMKHVRVAWADGAQVEMRVDNQPGDPETPACAPCSVLRFRGVGDQPVPVAVQFYLREYANDAEKGAFHMPTWPATKTAPSADAAATTNAVVQMLKANGNFNAAFSGAESDPVQFALSWDEKHKLAKGSVNFVKMRATKAVEGFIVDDKVNPPYLQLIETGPIHVESSSNALIGMVYRLSTDVQGPADRVIKHATYGDTQSGRVVDVTNAVRALVRQHALSVPVKARLLGVGDPAYGVVKSLNVECTEADGSSRTFNAKDGDTLSVDHVCAAVGTLAGPWSYRANTLDPSSQQSFNGSVALTPSK